jgi:hypothetical protein
MTAANLGVPTSIGALWPAGWEAGEQLPLLARTCPASDDRRDGGAGGNLAALVGSPTRARPAGALGAVRIPRAAGKGGPPTSTFVRESSCRRVLHFS